MPRRARTRRFPPRRASCCRRCRAGRRRWSATWRATDRLSLTAAARYASRHYGTIDNSDPVGNTFQGFYKYHVVDLRAALRVTDRLTLGLGVDNVGNDKYFLYHPFPQRTLFVQAAVAL